MVDPLAAAASAAFALWAGALLVSAFALAVGARASPGATSRALALIRE